MKKLIALIILMTFLFSGCVTKEKDNGEFGQVSFVVVDGFSGLPIDDAKIVLPENDCILVSDENGKTEAVNIRVIKNDTYAISQDYGTFSVLGYKDGYNDYALFFAQIKNGQERIIKLYMFLKDTPLSSGTPLATIESPDKEWVKEMVEKYRE